MKQTNALTRILTAAQRRYTWFQNSTAVTKTLAVIGMLLAWFPIAATLVFSALGTLRSGMFRLDYLMPAEFFPAALAGGLLLLWAAWRARVSRLKLIAWSFGLVVVLLVGGLMILPTVTGLASGATEPTGLPWALVMGSLAAYTLALIALGIGGVLLVRDLLRRA